MFFWFAATSVFLVWWVFQSPAIDFRMVALGSVIPLIGIPIGVTPLDSLVVPVAMLAAVMLATMGNRLLRRRVIGIPIGMFLYLVLNGSWTDQEAFWWPLTSLSMPDAINPVVGRGIFSIALEAVGIAIAVKLFEVFGLDDAVRRSLFVRTGQLDRTFVKSRSSD